MTAAERALWTLLRGERLGYKFRRQHPIGPFVLDFFCFEAGLVVEVDGPCHQRRRARDRRRDQWLESLGLAILRLTNQEVLAKPAQALLRIRGHLESASPRGPTFL